MTGPKPRYCVAALFSLVLAGVLVGRCAANSLLSVDVKPLAAGGVEFQRNFSDSAPEPFPFTIDNPARIPVDLRGTALA